METSITRALLLHAILENLGGDARLLAQKLGIGEPLLREFLSGACPLPDALFLAAVDLQLEQCEPHDANQVRGADEGSASRPDAPPSGRAHHRRGKRAQDVRDPLGHDLGRDAKRA